MAVFIGTNQEFRRYIGPRLRNLVQYITKRHKALIGACEHCGSHDSLESAHVHGRERNEIIDDLLGPLTVEGVCRVEVEQFENDFKAEHNPLEKSILILCKSCHRKYDASSVGRISGVRERSAVASLEVSRVSAGVLPITLDPSDPSAFKSALLKSKKAEIEVFYKSNEVEVREWNADRFKESSNVFGNLRSRTEFRAGVWQSNGIVKIHVRVL